MTNPSMTSAIVGMKFTQALFLVFLILKLTGVITWSWWFVTMPLWGGITLLVGGAVIFLFCVFCLYLVVSVCEHLCP